MTAEKNCCLLLAMFQPRFLTLLAYIFPGFYLTLPGNISEMSNIPGYTCCTNESTADSSKCDSQTFVNIFYFEHFWTIQAYTICFHPKSPLQRFRTLTRGVYTAPRAPRSWSFKSHVPCDGWVCGLGIAWRLQILSMKPINDHPVAIRSKQPQEQ
jgi:hypothetical protein